MAQKAGYTGKVISIEAAPGNAARLIQNIKLHNFEDRVEVIKYAKIFSISGGHFTKLRRINKRMMSQSFAGVLDIKVGYFRVARHPRGIGVSHMCIRRRDQSLFSPSNGATLSASASGG
jgi:hypothetical protein